MTAPPPSLLLASRLLASVNAAARWWFTRILQPHRAALPVISVGNIACGGTGKTPTVAALARELQRAGYQPAILTRGYRRRGRTPTLLMGPPADWREVGDEPALLAATLAGVPIVVDADRVRGAATAAAHTPATHLILDDGFQHWRLARDLDLVVVDASDPLAWRSPRREGPRALAHADAIVLANATPETVASATRAVRRYAPTVPLLATRLVVRCVRSAQGEEPPRTLSGARVFAVAGIASPHRFLATLRELGAEPVRYRFYPDHHALTSRELVRLQAEAEREQLLLVTTAKDAVKLPPPFAARIRWLETEAECLAGSFGELLAPFCPTVG